MTPGGRWGRVVPFAAAGFVALATVLIPPHPRDPIEAAVALGVLVSVVLCSIWLPWERLPVWAQSAPPFAFFAVFVLANDAAGGVSSGLAPMVMLPVFWLALYGTRRQLLLSLAFVGAAFLVPIVLIGGESYPVSDWRRGVLWMALGAIVGLTVQKLVSELEARRAEAERLSDVLAEISDSMRHIDGAGSRTRLCEAAQRIAGSSFAVLFEPRRGSLHLTSESGSDLSAAQVTLGAEPSGASVAFTSGERFFVENCRGHPAVSQRLVRQTGAESVLFEPVPGGDRAGVAGVLIVGWSRRIGELDGPTGTAIRLLALEAGAVLHRADLLAQLDALARTDALTGLPNRRAFDEVAETELRRVRGEGGRLVVAMIDIDHFKRFNDAEGHPAGDRLLKEIAGRWQGEIRHGDTIARYGGEEFAVLLSAASEDEAEATLGRLRRAMEPTGESCSIGAAFWDGSETLGTLVQRADAALYEAKRAGRDQLRLVI